MLKYWFSLRLHVQLALASGILLAITISITTVVNIQSQQQTLIENTTREAISLAKNISITGSYLVITNKLDELESLLIQSTTFPTISMTSVISAEGNTLSRVKKLASGDISIIFDLSPIKVPEDEKLKTSIDMELEKLVVWQPIKASTLLGWIKLDVSLNEVIKLQKQTIVDNLISAIIAIILDILFLLAILYVPAKRFKKIVNFSKSMTEHPGEKMDFSGGSYEINNLLNALNISSIQLEQQNSKIQKQAENLINLNAQKVLVQKESEQREMLESMLESVVTIDENGDILTFNKAAEALFGYSENEVIGKNVNILMPAPYAQEHQSYLRHYLEGGEARIIGIGREVEGKRKNGEIFSMRLSVAKLPKSIDGRRRFIGSCQDITLLKQQEEQLRRSNKLSALGKLTGGIAHDYNNLLAIIHGHAELLKMNLGSEPKLQKYTNEVLHASERGAKLTKKLLNFSQHKAPKTSVLNINHLLRELQFMLEKTLSSRIELKYDLTEDLWLVGLDSGGFEDTIINMAINAMHAIESEGQLILQTQNQQLSFVDSQKMDLPSGEYVILNIIDSGKGMDQATKEKIFDPFFSTKGEFGSGLGLSQVYGFMERCGGGIMVDSSPGEGACFSLYFPRSHQVITETENSIAEPKPVYEVNGKETLLVVDDEPAMVELACEILTTHGYHVFTASDGYQALKLLEKETIDLIISDVIMPNMGGYELANKVQQLYPDIKMLMVTGFTGDRQDDLGNKTLHQNYLYKPYSSNLLLEKIQKILNSENEIII